MGCSVVRKAGCWAVLKVQWMAVQMAPCWAVRKVTLWAGQLDSRWVAQKARHSVVMREYLAMKLVRRSAAQSIELTGGKMAPS